MRPATMDSKPLQIAVDSAPGTTEADAAPPGGGFNRVIGGGGDQARTIRHQAVPIISFFWRDPSQLVARAKEGGAIVMHTVGSAADAKRAIDAGVDIVVAQGWEAGGHVRGYRGDDAADTGCS